MCGRIAIYRPLDALARYFDAGEAPGLEYSYQPSYNVAPTRDLIGLVATRDGGRVLKAYRWGLVPASADDALIGSRLFNARAEGLRASPSFGPATKSRRLAIIVDGFFEWQHDPGRRGRPFFFRRDDGDPLALAGLWESWRDPAAGDAGGVLTCTMITTVASADVAAVHDRMPAVLEGDALRAWLEHSHLPQKELEHLLRPAPAGTLAHHPVDLRVGNVHNDSPELIVPVEPGEAGASEPQLRLFG